MAQIAQVPSSVVIDHLIWSSVWRTLAADRYQLAVALVVTLTLALLSRWLRRRPGRGRDRSASLPTKTIRFHLRAQLRARYALRKLAEIDPTKQPALAFQYLRSVCPFTFEEMILLQLRARRLSIQRNAKYTADGGVDGRFVVAGQLWLIQAKRYSGMVRPADIMDFAAACEAECAFGLFVHTGRTPPEAHTIARQSRVVDVLSGDRLMTFFAGDKLRLRLSSS